MDYKIVIELLFTFSPLIFCILIGFFVNVELTQEEIESVKVDVDNQTRQGKNQ